MYNPPRFKSTDVDEAFELMDQYPFATLITVADSMPIVSHLPLTPKKIGDKIELLGHLARANSHAKCIANSLATVIFHGPHSYITPTWYAADDVPTWNYAKIHVIGKVQLIESYEGIVDCLKELTTHLERHWPSGWNFYIPQELSGEALVKSIVGFRIEIDEMNFKKKFSQNRTPADRAGVLKGLEQRSDENSQAVLAQMKKLFFLNGEKK